MWTLFFSKTFWIVLVGSAAFCGSLWKAYTAGESHIQVKLDALIIQQAQATAKAVKDAQEKQAAIQDAADQQRKVDHDAYAKVSSNLSVALDTIRMLHKPQPAGYVPPTAEAASAGPGCSPASLYREDAGVALQFAAEADNLRIAYLGCQAQYNAAREALKGTP